MNEIWITASVPAPGQERLTASSEGNDVAWVHLSEGFVVQVASIDGRLGDLGVRALALALTAGGRV